MTVIAAPLLALGLGWRAYTRWSPPKQKKAKKENKPAARFHFAIGLDSPVFDILFLCGYFSS